MVLLKPLLYPVVAASNFFSITALLIITGLLGFNELAADIAIVQAAIVAVFLSLSGNARNMILSADSKGEEKSLFYFRLLAMFPAGMAVLYLTTNTIEVPTYLVIGLILRKCSEWGVELQLASGEKADDYQLAFRYIRINVISFLTIVLTILIPSWIDYFPFTLYFWALLPILVITPYLRLIREFKKYPVSFINLIPHLGSTAIIGISMYVFRILIIILIGKSFAGQMFTAYALGGLVSSLYTHAIGPTLMLKKSTADSRILLTTVSVFVVLGMAVILTTLRWEANWYSSGLLLAIGCSIIGGALMLVAQRQRLYILQVLKKDVFVPDALANMLLIISIPFAYYLFGVTAAVFFFLWSAVLHLFFYLPLAYKNKQKHA